MGRKSEVSAEKRRETQLHAPFEPPQNSCNNDFSLQRAPTPELAQDFSAVPRKDQDSLDQDFTRTGEVESPKPRPSINSSRVLEL